MRKIISALFLVSLIVLFAFKEGGEAPGFMLQALEGDNVSLTDLRGEGNIVILSFFDTNCKPCIKELPKLKKIYSDYRNKGVVVRMISIDEKGADVVKQFVKKYRVNVPVLLDPLGYRAGERYGVVAFGNANIPQLFVIGKNGKIRRIIKGYREDLEQVLSGDINRLKQEKLIKKKKDEIVILYTASSNGYIKSCDCPENPFGGLLRRASLIKEERSSDPELLLLDAGDNFSPYENKDISPYILASLMKMDYDAIGLGDQEFINGIDFFNKLRSESSYASLPIVASNMKFCDDKQCWYFGKNIIYKDIKGVRFAIIGFTSPGVFTLFPQNKIKGLETQEISEVLPSMIKEARSRADYVILISHSGFDEDREIAGSIEGIDLIVGGHSQTTLKETVRVNDTIIVQPGEKGQYVGKLKLVYENGKLIRHENMLLALTKDIPNDQGIQLLLNDYNESVKEKAQKVIGR